MSTHSQNNREEELRRREKELQDREMAIRLRELEDELRQPPLYSTVKHSTASRQKPQSSIQPGYGGLVKVGKFLALVVGVVVAMRIAVWLATVIMVGGIAWVAYKLFLEGDRSNP